MQTIQQQRAKHALEQVEHAKSNAAQGKFTEKEYRSHAAALPIMIQNSGLGQAAAFYRSNKAAHQALYQLLSDWLCDTEQPYHAYDDLLTGITTADMHQYRLAQVEAQALLQWVVKFAKAYMAEHEETASQDNRAAAHSGE